jgi:hypothetical protein
MYGTGSAAGDVEVKHRVDKIRAALPLEVKDE